MFNSHRGILAKFSLKQLECRDILLYTNSKDIAYLSLYCSLHWPPEYMGVVYVFFRKSHRTSLISQHLPSLWVTGQKATTWADLGDARRRHIAQLGLGELSNMTPFRVLYPLAAQISFEKCARFFWMKRYQQCDIPVRSTSFYIRHFLLFLTLHVQFRLMINFYYIFMCWFWNCHLYISYSGYKCFHVLLPGLDIKVKVHVDDGKQKQFFQVIQRYEKVLQSAKI